MKDNKCVVCGEIIPEGRQVCPNCENKRIKDKHGYKRITERLDIHITYKPNGYIEEYDDWELEVTVNGESQTVMPFIEPLKDLTIKQLLAEVKDVVEELLGD